MLDDEVGGLADVAPVVRAGAPELPGEHDRQRRPGPSARPSTSACRRPACSAGTSRRRAAARRSRKSSARLADGLVARREQRGGDLVEVARPDEVVRRRARVVGVDRQLAPAPRHARRGDERARVVLVLVRLEHEQRRLVGGRDGQRGGRDRAAAGCGSRPSPACRRRRRRRSRRRARPSATVERLPWRPGRSRARASGRGAAPRPVRRVWACWTTLPGRSAS